MNDLLKEARMSVMTIGATKYNKPSEFINSTDYGILCIALNHYEELLKKEEAVKPIHNNNAKWKSERYCSNCYNWIGSTTDTTNKYCYECGTKIDWSDT